MRKILLILILLSSIILTGCQNNKNMVIVSYDDITFKISLNTYQREYKEEISSSIENIIKINNEFDLLSENELIPILLHSIIQETASKAETNQFEVYKSILSDDSVVWLIYIEEHSYDEYDQEYKPREFYFFQSDRSKLEFEDFPTSATSESEFEELSPVDIDTFRSLFPSGKEPFEFNYNDLPEIWSYDFDHNSKLLAISAYEFFNIYNDENLNNILLTRFYLLNRINVSPNSLEYDESVLKSVEDYDECSMNSCADVYYFFTKYQFDFSKNETRYEYKKYKNNVKEEQLIETYIASSNKVSLYEELNKLSTKDLFNLIVNYHIGSSVDQRLVQLLEYDLQELTDVIYK